VLSGILFVIRNGLRWRDAPSAYGPPKTIYNRSIRWSRLGVFSRFSPAVVPRFSFRASDVIDVAGAAFEIEHAMPAMHLDSVQEHPVERHGGR